MHQYEIQFLRMALGKAATGVFAPGIHTGKMTEEKAIALRDSWVRYLARTFPDKDLLTVAGYSFAVQAGEDGQVAMEEEVFQTIMSCL